MKKIRILKLLREGTIKTFINAHRMLFWVLVNILPIIITSLLIMLVFIVIVSLGIQFHNENHFMFTLIFVGGAIFVLFYEIIKNIIKKFLK